MMPVSTGAHRAETHAPDVASDFDQGHGGSRVKEAKVVGNDGAGECSTV